MSRIADQIEFIEAEPAERSWIELVHDPDYVETILSMKIDDPVTLDWGDTVATSATPLAALHAAGAGVQAVKLVLDGSYPVVFCAARPPGHHAEPNRAMGFCVFNNIAVAAAYLVNHTDIKRVAIVDWDVHHGNGTEKAFFEDDRVLYISLHQFPYYPGTGPSAMQGKGDGLGYNINIPMRAGSGNREYSRAFADKVIPAIDDFKPDFILISAGFDGHNYDPLAGMQLTTSAFGEMTRQIKDCADRHCEGRIVSFLEGGYDLEGLAECVEEHLTVLAE